jgi:hypothetical protein
MNDYGAFIVTSAKERLPHVDSKEFEALLLCKVFLTKFDNRLFECGHAGAYKRKKTMSSEFLQLSQNLTVFFRTA